MAKKGSRISINKLEDVMMENVTVIPMNENKDVNITIRRTLPLRDMMQFVENVVSSCVDMDNASYTPEIKDFAIRSEILSTYANFNLPSNVEKQYELVYRTNVLDQVMEHIDKRQLDEIKTAINERITHEVNMIETALSAKTNDMMAHIETMIDQFETVFDGINNNDFNGIMKKISEMSSITEESIAKAVLDIQREELESDTEEDKVITFQKLEK